MFDLKLIRENPDAFDAALARRGEAAASSALLDMDARFRSLQTTAQEAQARRNEASKLIGQAIRDGDKDTAEALKAEVTELKGKLTEMEEQERALEAELTDALSRLPNWVYDDVPDGDGEEENALVRSWGDKPAFDFEPKEHFALGELLGMMDFERAAKLSGSRFVLLNGQLARFERAIGQFMLDLQVDENGYQEVTTPVMVREAALYGTGQLPKFADDLFHTQSDHFLIPTAEATLTNIRSGEILDEADLPLRFTALTSCFRAEAGAAGRDTRGMIRQHQFNKVEMVCVTKPEDSDAELERMTGCAEMVLQKLKIPYQVMKLCTGDIGFGARRTYDIEVWLPGQDRFREISSCSTTGDFQARRMKMRCREKGEKKTRFPHTLNGSGLAVGRTLIAVMENYQDADGGIRIPEALQPYMGGLNRIGPA